MTSYQVLLLTYLSKYIGKHGHSPSMREISKGTGKGMATVYTNLKILVKTKKIVWHRNIWRGIEIHA